MQISACLRKRRERGKYRECQREVGTEEGVGNTFVQAVDVSLLSNIVKCNYDHAILTTIIAKFA